VEDFFEHIDEYKNGLLEGDQLAAFERAMKEDASLKKAVENYDVGKAISEGLLEVDMLETLERLKEQRKSGSGSDSDESEKGGATVHDIKDIGMGPRPKNRKISLRKWIAATSFIGVLVFAGWWVMEWNGEREYMDYVKANYEWPEDLDATKSVDTIGMNDFEKGKHFFERNHFEESLRFLIIHLSEETDISMLSEGYEWLGAIYMKQGAIEKAKRALEKSYEKKALNNLKLLNSTRDK